LPRERAASQSDQTNNPSKDEVRDEVGLDVSHHPRISQRGGEKLFFLDILFYRMSAQSRELYNLPQLRKVLTDHPVERYAPTAWPGRILTLELLARKKRTAAFATATLAVSTSTETHSHNV
jgi:hypothetical protein